MPMPGQSNKCSINALLVECYACQVIYVSHTTVHWCFRRFLWRKDSLFSILMQSRSWARGIGNWDILDLQILMCAIIIICMRQWYIPCKQLKFLAKKKRTFKEKLPTFEDKVHCSLCQELFSEGMRPVLQLDVSTLRFFYVNSRLKFPVDAGFICDQAPVTTAMLTGRIEATPHIK